MNNVNDGAGSYSLQVFEVGPCMATVGVGRVDTLSGEVVELLEVGVHYNFLLVGVFEGLGARDGSLTTGGDGRAAPQTSHVSTQDIHEDRLGNVVGVVSRHDLVNSQHGRSTIQSLSTKHPAERAVVSEADGRHDAVHGPAVEVLVGEDLQRDPVLTLVPPDGLEGVVSVTSDPLVDGEQEKVQPVVVALVEDLHEVGQHRGVLPARRSDGYHVASREEAVGHDGLVDFRLNCLEETLLAGCLTRLGPFEDCRAMMAECTFHWHLFHCTS